MRTLAVWCPDWPVMAHLRDVDSASDSRAIAVLAKGQVLACSQAARAEGVRRGMKRRDAQSRCPELVLRDHDPDADARSFERVLSAIEQLTGQVVELRPGLAALEVPSRYYGGEREAAAVVAEHLVGLGVWDVRCGVADTVFAAEQAARQALAQDCVVVEPGQTAAFLSAMGSQILSEELAPLLRRLGLATVGDVATVPLADLHTRFGPLGSQLYRLSHGFETQRSGARKVSPELVIEASFEPGLDRIDTICFSLRASADKFVAQLADLGQVAVAVRVEVESDAQVGSRLWRHPRWFAAADLIDRVRWQLAGQPPGAPVDTVRFVPEVMESLGDHATSLFGNGTDDQVERQVARVQSMLGPEAVRSAGVQGGRSPAERQLTATWGTKPEVRRPPEQPWPGAIPPPAPARVFSPVRSARVVAQGGLAVMITARGAMTGEPARFCVGDTWRTVAAWAGPWPVDDAWWDEHAARRIARFQLVGVDGTAWLLCIDDGQWWAEAQYD